MLVDSDTVELSQNESQSGTLVWNGEAGTYRIGVSTEDDAGYGTREIVEAIVATTALTGQSSTTFDWTRNRGLSSSLNNSASKSANSKLGLGLVTSLTGSSSAGALLSIKLFNSSGLSNNSDISLTEYIARYTSTQLESNTFLAFESANKEYAIFDGQNSPVFQPNITWGVRLKPSLSNDSDIGALGSRYFSQSADMSDSSVFNSNGIRAKKSVATLTGTSSVTFLSDLQKYFSVGLSGNGALDLQAVNFTFGAATWNNNSILEASEFVQRYASLDYSGASVLTSNYTRVRTRSFTHEGTGSIEPVSILRRNRIEGQYRVNAVLPLEREMEALAGDESMAARVLDR